MALATTAQDVNSALRSARLLTVACAVALVIPFWPAVSAGEPVRLGTPVDSGVEAIPVPSVASRVPETVPSDVITSAAYRVPKGVTIKQLVAWYKKRVTFAADWPGGWVWCDAPASSLTKRNPQWNWTRPGSGDEDTDNALVLHLTRKGKSAVRYISVAVGPDFPC